MNGLWNFLRRVSSLMASASASGLPGTRSFSGLWTIVYSSFSISKGFLKPVSKRCFAVSWGSGLNSFSYMMLVSCCLVIWCRSWSSLAMNCW